MTWRRLPVAALIAALLALASPALATNIVAIVNDQPITELDLTQRISLLYGMPTFWPQGLRRAFYGLAGRSRWLTQQRTRTARHIPTGTAT